MPDAVGLELIAKEINAAHEGAVSETGHEYGSATLVIAAESNLEVLRWLEETPGQEYTFCSSVHGADYLPAEPRFAVHYELLNRDRVERIHVKALLGDPSAETDDRWGEGPLPTLRSSVGIFPTAEFQ
ncbi:MAG: NADH-quinone oxidoreductase subunit C, partial [bacterium]